MPQWCRLTCSGRERLRPFNPERAMHVQGCAELRAQAQPALHMLSCSPAFRSTSPASPRPKATILPPWNCCKRVRGRLPTAALKRTMPAMAGQRCSHTQGCPAPHAASPAQSSPTHSAAACTKQAGPRSQHCPPVQVHRNACLCLLELLHVFLSPILPELQYSAPHRA